MSGFVLKKTKQLGGGHCPPTWNGRNLYKHEGKRKNAKTLVCEASNFSATFKKCTTKACPPSTPLPHRGSQWRPPENGWYKINVDGAVFEEDGSCGVGVVIRDSAGCLMGAMCKKLPLPLGPIEAEARAAEEGIILAWDLGLDKVIVEGDAKTIMVALSDPTNDAFPSSILKNMEGAKSKLQNFQAWQAKYVHRSGNNAAHVMARHACNIVDYIVWVEDTPPMIVKQIHKDVISLGLSQVE